MNELERSKIIRLLKIENELDLRKNYDKLRKYNSGEIVHVKQVEFHKCAKRNRWVFGGNRSGKTECGAVESIWWARGNHPYRQNRKDVSGWVVSLSYEVQRDVAQAKILHYLNPNWIHDIVMQSGKKSSPEYGIIDHIVIKNVFGGLSKIGFKSIDQGREKFQGASLDFVWFDEEPPKDIYDECRMRVLDRKGEVWGTMTPLKGLTWVYDDIYLNSQDNPEIWCSSMEWADNPFLDKTEIELLTSTMSKDDIESRRYGRFSNAEGLVYGEFDSNVNVIEPFDVPDQWKDNISIDPGLNNPCAVLFFAVDYDGNIYVIAEHYQSKKDIDYHANAIFEIADKLSWHKDSQGRLSALIDSASNQRTLASSKSVSELFYDRGIIVNTKVNKDIFSGIARVKNYLAGQPKLYVFKTCVNLIREFKSYWWGNGDNPKKIDDHALDALRYYIMSKPNPAKQEQKKSVIAYDKERLFKRLTVQKSRV